MSPRDLDLCEKPVGVKYLYFILFILLVTISLNFITWDGDTGLDVRGGAGPAQVGDGAKGSGETPCQPSRGPAWCQHRPGLSHSPLAGRKLGWHLNGGALLEAHGCPRWEGYEEVASSDRCGLEGTGVGGLGGPSVVSRDGE